MKITDIRTAEVRVHGHQTHVRIYTDSGLIGQGEATDAAVGTAALVRSFRPFLIGKDPLNVDAIWEQIRVSGIFAGAQGGQYVTALTGVEIALWDLAGKALGLPIYQLLGGKFRDRVRMYCDSDMKDPLGRGSGQKERVDQGERLYGHEDRHRRCHGPGALRPSELDGEQRRNRPHGELGAAHPRDDTEGNGPRCRHARPL